MIRSLARIALLAPLLGTAGPAAAQAGPPSILTAKHNFQLQTNPVHADAAATEDGICVFCHTPHKGASSLLLWNHTFSAEAYSWTDVGGGGKTTGGTVYPGNLQAWSGSTRKCLSCHDGTVSVGSLYWSNAAGVTGRDATAGGAPVSVAMAGPDQTAGRLTNRAYVITGGGLGGADLTGNHPVGVPYPYANQKSTYNGITTGPDVRLEQWAGTPSNVKIFGAGGGGAPSAGAAGIECASCHDPHGTGNEFFLRVTKRGSQLCLTCHLK